MMTKPHFTLSAEPHSFSIFLKRTTANFGQIAVLELSITINLLLLLNLIKNRQINI